MGPLRDAGITLSLANLCFFRVWSAHFYGYLRPYFRKDVSLADVAALALDVLLLAVLFWAAARLARRSKQPLARLGMRLGFLLVLLVIVDIIRQGLAPQAGQLVTEPAPWSPRAVLLGLVLAAVALYGGWRWRQSIPRVCARMVLILSPFVVVTFSQAVWITLRDAPPETRQDRPLAPLLPLSNPPRARLLWLVFDGMDQRLSFAERPAGLELPELDRLRSQSLYAPNAFSPATATLSALPALITGRFVDYAEPGAANELMVGLHGTTDIVPWSRQPSVFSRARAAGVNPALAGWFHPYCRLLGQELTGCAWVPYQFTGEPRTLPERMRDQAALLLWSLPFGPAFFGADPLDLNLLPTRLYRQNHTRRYVLVHASARKMAGDAALGLIFVHVPVPHGPPIYDRRTGEFGDVRQSKGWYLDNLALVDRTLAELRQTLEEAGLWERTAILLSSDHAWPGSVSLDGKRDPRVPFLFRLPGQTRAVTYEAPFNTVLSHDLVLALLGGEFTEPEQVARWLDEHRGTAPGSPPEGKPGP